SKAIEKRIELLRDVVPGLRRLAIMANVDNSYVALEIREVQAATRTLGLEAALFEIRRAEDIALAFDGLKGRAQALYVMPDPILFIHRLRINTLALGARLPTMHSLREYVEASILESRPHGQTPTHITERDTRSRIGLSVGPAILTRGIQCAPAQARRFLSRRRSPFRGCRTAAEPSRRDGTRRRRWAAPRLRRRV